MSAEKLVISPLSELPQAGKIVKKTQKQDIHKMVRQNPELVLRSDLISTSLKVGFKKNDS